MDKVINDLDFEMEDGVWYLIGYVRGTFRFKDTMTLEEWNEAVKSAEQYAKRMKEMKNG